MLTKGDLEKIDNLLGKQDKRLDRIEKRLASNTASVIRMENKIDKALELRIDVSEIRKQVQDHEERISHLEKFS